MKARITLPEELQQLLTRVQGMSPAARTRALSALQTSLHQRWHEIYVTPPSALPSSTQPGAQQQQQQQQHQQTTQAGSVGLQAGATGTVRSDVVRCALQLAALAAELSPEEGGRRAEGEGMKHEKDQLFYAVSSGSCYS